MYPEVQPYGEQPKSEKVKLNFRPQHQSTMPGHEHLMDPLPIADNPDYKASGKCKGKTVVITGGDSGIGRAAAIAFAKEGANVSVIYYTEDLDAKATKHAVESYGGHCLLVKADLKQQSEAVHAVTQTVGEYGGLDCVVNNAAVQYSQQSLLDITPKQLLETFQTNIFSYFYVSQAALPHLKKGDSIINTASVTAYKGNKTLIDYSATKGAIVTFTRSLALSLVDSGIRVNAVAPGPIWTPLIPASFTESEVSEFGNDTPMKRAGQPFEVAPAYIYLASEDSGFMTGQVLHINGGEIING
ncbi:SDR family oxidoreductase [Alicyclobacillus sp. SO9]|uniref:SDR family oxidoreductase n=1 Tax=Alicyclobacillus sp. SO9 TaxID=2665646 RepID=UPI0018E844B3|nr:SDR family oxidoreductase [Alicyclobacillus sp. SO9]QQE77708.1 SDR family oxidoreductase [Alicyclobacillus sp. SO9]